jgi:ABC-2 type transport system permease protein
MWNRINAGFKNIAGYFSDELKIIRHDAGAVLVFVIAMIVYPLFYSIAYQNETIRDNPMAVVDLDHSALSRQLIRMVDASEQLDVTCKPGSLAEAEQLFYDGSIRGVMLIPPDFEKDILKGQQTRVTVYCDASYFLLYKQIYSGAIYSSGTFGAGIEIKKMLAEGKNTNQAIDQHDPLKVKSYNLYNPSGGYSNFVMPGIILVIMQQTLLIGIGLLGGTTRERNRFHHHRGPVALPGGSVAAVLGKSGAYLLIYLMNSLYAILIVPKWFSFPDQSGFLPALLLLIPFILSVSFLGLAISVLFKKRVNSLLFMVFLSPCILFLTGLSWPASSIPPVLYSVAHIFPSTLMVPAYLRMRIYGADIASVSYEWGWMLVQMIIYFILACFAYKLARIRFDKENAEEETSRLSVVNENEE